MIEQLQQMFSQQGYRRLQTNVPEVTGFCKAVGQHWHCICLIDARGGFLNGYGKQDHLIQQMGSFVQEQTGGTADCLGIIFTENVSAVRQNVSGQADFWIVDTVQRRLIRYENQPQTFYGVEQWIESLLYESESSQPSQSAFYGTDDRIKAFHLTPVNTALVVINVLIFFVLEVLGDTENAAYIYQFGGMTVESVLFGGEFWRLLSCAFLHFGFSHLFNNMLVLAFAGDNLERALGSVKYLLFYLCGAVGSSLISCICMFLGREQYVVSAGASGAIFAVLGGIFYVLVRNHGRKDDLNIWKVGLFLFFSIFQGFTSVTTNNSAHISGLLLGVVLAFLFYRKKAA